MNKNYIYDAIENKLLMSNAFARKASQVGTKEYGIVRKLMKDYPDATIGRLPEKPHLGLTYEKMKKHISLYKDEKRMEEFDRQCRLSHVQPMPYRYVETWFKKNYPNYSDAAAAASVSVSSDAAAIERGDAA